MHPTRNTASCGSGPDSGRAPSEPPPGAAPHPALADDEAALAERGLRLAEAVAAALPAWVDRLMRQRVAAVGTGAAVPCEVPDEVVTAVAAQVEAEVLPRLRALLARDVDEQLQSPLAVLRTAAATVGGALDALGVPPPERDDHQRQIFPDDHHNLVPATFADLSEEAGRAGIEWGAAKAFVHRRRHRG